MQLEKIENVDIVEKEMSEAQKNDLFGNIIRGKDVTETISTSRGDFKVKFPRTKDLETIGRVLAFRLNGIPVQSVDPNVYALMQQIATLDVVVLSGPAWYENAKKEGKFTTWGDIPMQSYVQEVYGKAYSFRDKVQKELELGENAADSKVDSGKNDNVSDSPGLFEGLSDRS